MYLYIPDTNAGMLRIDLTMMIISPLIEGQLMTSISVAVGCVFIVGWNVASLGLEYLLLRLIYDSTPALQVAKRGHKGTK